MRRRHFIQAATVALSTVGLQHGFGATRLGPKVEKYSRAIAQSTSRKLALLVGANQYPAGIKSLGGCVTDVRMQYELLVHRFGFNPADIVILSDEAEYLPSNILAIPPTRANILDAFEQHLIAQAKENDIVVFHYSGHGSRVLDPVPIPQFSPFNGTLMPTDARDPSAQTRSAEGPVVDDIMGKTIFLLTHLLKTDQVTTILDACYSGGGTRGNLVYRSVEPRAGGVDAVPSETERAYQAYLMEKAGLSEAKLLELRTAGIAKGIALGSAQANQLAADATFGSGTNQFKAGAFTYTLTRYLWQQSVSQPLNSVFVKLARSTRDVANDSRLIQEPIYNVATDCSVCQQQPAYFLSPSTPSAEAVVTRVNGSDITFWLGGISSRSLDAFTPGTIFSLVNDRGQAVGEVEQTTRRGLIGTGRLVGSAQATVTPGLFLRERIRGVPSNPTLHVGLHSSLSSAERSAAQSSIASISRVKSVADEQNGEIDFFFGRMNADARVQAEAAAMSDLPPPGSLCLFSSSLIPVPNSWGNDYPNETIEEAINRLSPRFKMLLAGRILKYVLNTDTSDVKLEAKVETVGGRGSRGQFGSRGITEAGLSTQSLAADTQQLTAGTEIQLVLKNNEPRALYMAVLVVDSEGNLVILHPLTGDAAEADALVPSGETLIVPPPNPNPSPDDFQFTVRGPAGFFELLAIASTEPLRDALKALDQVASTRGGGNSPYALDGDEAVNVIGALLGDFDRSSRAGVTASYRGSQQGVDTTKLAAISAIFEVVE
ncbi:MAG: caspase family protein [Cyanobacteria bacterium J06632_3]